MEDVGVSRDTVFQEIRPGAGFETGDFVKEKLGGYRRTTPRPWHSSCYDNRVAILVSSQSVLLWETELFKVRIPKK